MLCKNCNTQLTHSQIRVGKNKWEIELDKSVYPWLATNMCNSMLEYLEQKREGLDDDMYNRLKMFLEAVV